MIYGYIRVSSDKQTIENQRFEINNFCSKNSILIDGWIEETISGTKNYNKRALCIQFYFNIFPIMSIHLRFCSMLGCTYKFSVVLMFECPNSTLTVL